MVEFKEWIKNLMESDPEEREISEEEIEVRIQKEKTEIKTLENQIEKIEDEYENILQDISNSDNVKKKPLKQEALILKNKMETFQAKIHFHRERLRLLQQIQMNRTDLNLIQSEIKDYTDLTEELSTLSHIGESDSEDRPDVHNNLHTGETTIDPFHDLQTLDLPLTDSVEREIGDDLVPTPYTLWQFPKTDVFSYFYYLTDDKYTEKDSKFYKLDKQLTWMGRNRSGLEVGIFDRDRMREKTWQIIVDGLDIDDYPALIAAESPVGVREIGLHTNSFTPNDVPYAKLENGVFSDRILQDSDEVRDLLNKLFDATRDNEVESQMRNTKIVEYLTIAKEEIQDILNL